MSEKNNRWFYFLLLCLLMGTLTACGQYGRLYLPDEPQKNTMEQQT